MTDSARNPHPPPRQVWVYRNYLQMLALAANQFHPAAENLAGRLVFCVGFGQKGAELALASAIAGGTFLGIDSSSEQLKAAVRNGSCDFMVNTLDESLRVLKNELRKRKALSVGLLGSASEIIPAMVERGVQPDMIADTSLQQHETATDVEHQALLQLLKRGAGKVDAQTEYSPEHSTLVEVTWTAANAADLKRLDSIAREHLPPKDQIRRRWLLQSSGCFHRQLPFQRILGLRPEELPRLLSAFRDAASAGKIQSPASIHWQDPQGVEQMVLLQPS